MKRLAAFFLVALLVLPGLAQAKIFLADTDDTLRVVTASGVTTIHMYAAWADLTTTALTPGSSSARVTTATTTVLVAAPAASTQRQIKGLTIRNNHASSSNAITVEFFDGTNATELVKYTLLAGETLEWGEDENFKVIDASGQIKGLVAATQSGTWTVQPGNTANTTPWLATINQGGNSAVVTTTTPGASDAGVVVRNINSSAAADNSTNSTAKSPVIPCRANAAAPTWTEGNQAPCSVDLSGNERVNVANINGVAPSMGAGNTGTGVQRVIEATDSQLSAGVGATGDAAATAGSTGSMNAKQRLMTSQLDSIKTAVETIDNIVSGSGANISQYNGATAQVATNSLNTTGAGLPAAAMVGQCDDTTPTALTENQFGHARINCTTHQQLVEVGTALPAGSNVIGALTANQSVNVAQINGVTPLMGAGNTGTGSHRVTIATDQSALNGLGVYVEDAAETAGANLAMAGSVRRDTAASSAGTTGDNATVNTDGLGRLWVREGSPCADHARITSASISESTAATNEIVALNASDLIYVCGYKWVTTAANSLSWKYGTGTDCATGTTSIEGAQPFAANGGVVENGGGYPLFIVPAGNALCLTSSAATAHGGRVTYVRTAAP